MLDELKKQGWSVERDENGTITIFACFDDGFWSYVYVCSVEVFADQFEKDQAFVEKAVLGDATYVVISMTTHRMTNPYDSYNLDGKATNVDDALSIAYDVCQSLVARFDAFCDD